MESDYTSFPPIGIMAYSDSYDVPDRRVWGDYWLKENLLREFDSLRYPLDSANPSVLLHLFGEPAPTLPGDTFNILWVHSHPDWINPGVLDKYSKVYCISKRFIGKMLGMGYDAEYLMLPTAMTPVQTEKRIDILFVGNTKKGEVRKIVRDLGSTAAGVKIWGWGWKGLVPDSWHGGEYFENGRLNELYASAKIVLNDHHEDMRREGFINPRILDVLASGGFVVSDSVRGMEEVLDNAVPTYETGEDLQRIVARYLRDDAARESLAARGRAAVLGYTYRAACLKIIKHIESIF